MLLFHLLYKSCFSFSWYLLQGSPHWANSDIVIVVHQMPSLSQPGLKPAHLRLQEHDPQYFIKVTYHIVILWLVLKVLMRCQVGTNTVNCFRLFRFGKRFKKSLTPQPCLLINIWSIRMTLQFLLASWFMVTEQNCLLVLLFPPNLQLVRRSWIQLLRWMKPNRLLKKKKSYQKNIDQQMFTVPPNSHYKIIPAEKI